MVIRDRLGFELVEFNFGDIKKLYFCIFEEYINLKFMIIGRVMIMV